MLMQKSVHSYTPPVLILLKLQTMVCPWLTMYKVALRCTLFVCFFSFISLLFAFVSFRLLSASPLLTLCYDFHSYHVLLGQLTQPHWEPHHPDHPASVTLPRVTRHDWKGHHAQKADQLRVQCQLSVSSSVPYSSISCSHFPVTRGKGPLGAQCPTVPFIFLFYTEKIIKIQFRLAQIGC